MRPAGKDEPFDSRFDPEAVGPDGPLRALARIREAANKVLVNQRMKRAGQRWSMRSERPYLQDGVGPLRRGRR